VPRGASPLANAQEMVPGSSAYRVMIPVGGYVIAPVLVPDKFFKIREEIIFSRVIDWLNSTTYGFVLCL